MKKYLKQLKGKIQKVWSVEYSFNITFPLYWWSVIIGIGLTSDDMTQRNSQIIFYILYIFIQIFSMLKLFVTLKLISQYSH